MNDKNSKLHLVINKDKYENDKLFKNLISEISKIDEGDFDRTMVISLLHDLKSNIDDLYGVCNGFADAYCDLETKINNLRNKYKQKVES